MIRIEKLSKQFGSLAAVSEISLEARQGEIFGLLGPNGAGKTTTINMICGVLKPDGGQVLIDGRDIWTEPKPVKRILGVVPQEIALYEDLTARDNLHFWGSLYGLRGKRLKERVEECLDRVGLLDRAGGKVAAFSGGMKRRLNLCMGLIHEPRLLLLDEPTAGIDPQARMKILEIVQQLAAAGTTVLYTTHYMEEAQELCSRIAIIDHGKVLALGSLEELTRLAGEGELLKLKGSFQVEEAKRNLDEIEGARILSLKEGLVVLSFDSGGPGLANLLPAILKTPLQVNDLSIQRPDLQSVFLRLTGRELRD